MSSGDRLSDLPDDLLLRVLYFTPAREGASTGALSKRWRGLWRSSGALNLDALLNDEDHYNVFFSKRDAFVSAARLSLEAAAAADSPVTRLTFHVEAGRSHRIRDFLFLYIDNVNMARKERNPDVVTELLSLPAARRVEELRLAAGCPYNLSRFKNEEIETLHEELGELSFLCLPSDTLRVLDVTNCRGLQPSPGVAFPWLASLRLSHCSVWLENLQDLIHAAPALATVRLEFVMIRGASAGKGQPPPLLPGEGFTIHLRCPAATEIVLDRCCWSKFYSEHSGSTAVKIDAPRLRRFRYRGLLRQLALSSQAPDLARVDLHIIPLVDWRKRTDAGSNLVTFWRLAQSFCNAKEMKLRVNMLEDIAVIDSESQAKLLCSFPNLKRLQLEGMHKLNGKTAAATVANMLSCCPVLQDLRLNLTMEQPDSHRSNTEGRCFLEKKYRHYLQNSIQGFNNRKLDAMVSIQGDYGDGEARYDKLSDLPALSSGHAFDCLLNTLSCVRLQFWLEMNIFELKQKSNFAPKLIKFFAKNAMVLKEMHIDDGIGKMGDHMNCKLEQWVANSSQHRKKAFIVLPLES